MLAIKNNIMAENAARHLGVSYDALARSVERLSSGLRINTARDDAAGLAVRELMRADVAVLQQGVRNAQDGVSLLQTAEGGMQGIDNLLVRMKQLAEQAATGVYSSAQRSIMDSEFDELANEIERVAGSAEFNSISLLNSATGTVSVVFGDATDTITIDMQDMTKAGLGIDTVSINTAASAQAALAVMDTAIGTATNARAHFGAKLTRLDSTVGVLNIQAENLLTAESRISDVDVATEMAAMTRSQVLAQAGVSMLAQANVMPQMALNLLR
ncbi:MAG: flagellin N-terminal helical domain-containing protein [Planctomycetota bacterium]|jgi:flagellin